jgi:uncharacterized protein YqfA (UPF0365 family)
VIPLPNLSVTFLSATIAPLVIGFLVGIIAKSAMKIGIAIAIIVLILIGLGVLSPDKVLTPLLSLVKSGSALSSKVSELAGYLPYSSVAFLIGLAVGFFKG